MKKLSLIFVVCFLVFLFDTCKTDFELNADWKDITIVYGLLDKGDSVHYVRINKAYLGDGNALMMAKSFDSTNYKKEDLEVNLEEYSSGSSIPRNTYPLEWSLVSKDMGEFYDPGNPYQTIYKTKASLSESYSYKLVITNLKSGSIISAKTILVYPFNITKPFSTDKYVFGKNQKVLWNSARNGRSYQLILRFHFDEINKTTKEVVAKQVDLLRTKITCNTLSGGESMSDIINADDFFYNLSSHISVNPDVKRKPGKLDFIIMAAGEEFNTYLEVNKPSNSIAQERPNYTNIGNGGLGIFSCRYNNTRSIDMGTKSIDSLVYGRFTKNLGFYNPFIL